MKNKYQSNCLLCVFCFLLILPGYVFSYPEDFPPVANCKGAIATLNENGEATIDTDDIDWGSFDPDGGAVLLSLNRTHFTCDDIGNDNIVVLTVTDNEGNVSTCAGNVTLIDLIEPVARCKTASVNLDADGTATITAYDINNNSTDNCGITSISLSKTSFACEDLDAITGVPVTLVVRDAEGNDDVCHTSVRLADVTPPVAMCNDIIVELDHWGEAEIDPNQINNGSYDNCELDYPFPYSIDIHEIDCNNLGENTVTLTVRDKSGNIDYCTATVSVVDYSAPSLSCDDVDLFLDNNGEATLDFADLINYSYDNCGITNRVFDPPKTVYNCEDMGLNKVTVTFSDISGNTNTCESFVHVMDHISPQITCETELIFEADPDICGAIIPDINPKPVVTDNCDYYELTNNNSSGYYNIGNNNLEWTASDGHWIPSTCSQNILIVDKTPPKITCPSKIELATDQGSCEATCTESALGIATAEDNCEVLELTNNFADLFPDNKISFGKHLVTWKATDIYNNSAICEQKLEVNKVQTITSVTVTPATQQYSDPVTFRAEIDPGVCDEAGHAATHVTFYVGLQPMGPPVALNQTGQLLWAEATYDLLEYEGYVGTMNPAVNPKAVKASFSGLDPDFEVVNPSTELTVTNENACASYAGVLFASTAGVNSSAAVVTLAATVIEEADGFTNDLLKYAMLQFYNGASKIGPQLQLGWVTEGDKTIGTAIYEWPVDIGNANGITYSISAEVIGYYTNAPGDCWAATDVTVSKPLGEFITGGGYLLLENTAGIKAGDAGTKNSFGFNVKFTKKLTSLQGNINTTFRRTEDGKTKVLNAKGTAFTSLAVVNNYAVFTGKAVIKNITDPIYPFDEEGNATLQMSMTDNGDGTMDLLGITLWNKKGGLWFSSNWSGTKTVDQLLAAGNLVIHKSQVKSAEIIEIASDVATPGLKVYPNPFSSKLRFEFVYPESVNARIDLYDMTGRLVKTIFEQPIEGGVSYVAEFRPETIISGMYFYRVTMGEAIYNGKVVFKKE